MKLIEIQEVEKNRIKCDNPCCDFIQEIADSKPQDYVNKPCPKCGSILLTQKDLDAFNNLLKTIDFINSIGEKLPKRVQKYLEKKAQQSGPKKMQVSGDGTGEGKIIFKEVEQEG